MPAGTPIPEAPEESPGSLPAEEPAALRAALLPRDRRLPKLPSLAFLAEGTSQPMPWLEFRRRVPNILSRFGFRISRDTGQDAGLRGRRGRQAGRERVRVARTKHYGERSQRRPEAEDPDERDRGNQFGGAPATSCHGSEWTSMVRIARWGPEGGFIRPGGESVGSLRRPAGQPEVQLRSR